MADLGEKKSGLRVWSGFVWLGIGSIAPLSLHERGGVIL